MCGYELSGHSLKDLDLHYLYRFSINSFYLRFYTFKVFSIPFMMAQRTDWYCRVGQLSARRTNTNFSLPLRRNGHVSSEVQAFADDPFTSVEVLEGACEDESLRKNHKCTLKTYLLSKYFFNPNDHTVSTVAHRSYPSVKVMAIQLHVILLISSFSLLTQLIIYNM